MHAIKLLDIPSQIRMLSPESVEQNFAYFDIPPHGVDYEYGLMPNFVGFKYRLIP